MTKCERMQTQKIEMKSSETQRVSLEFGLDFINYFFLVNSNTYQNTYENSNISVLNWVYNTLHNQSTTTKEPKSISNSGVKQLYCYFQQQ